MESPERAWNNQGGGRTNRPLLTAVTATSRGRGAKLVAVDISTYVIDPTGTSPLCFDFNSLVTGVYASAL